MSKTMKSTRSSSRISGYRAWACRGGRRAIFAAFGLGKSLIQIEIIRLVQRRFGGDGLIVLPLGVRQEFRRDGMLDTDKLRERSAELGLDHADIVQTVRRDFAFVRRAEEMDPSRYFYLTNYESIRDGRLDPNLFICVSLDEASVLRSFGSKTYQTFLTLFHSVTYRFVATATPSPNKFKELIHYAGFLGIMDTGQALTRFFQRDSTQANNLTLYPHKEEEFWLWLSPGRSSCKDRATSGSATRATTCRRSDRHARGPASAFLGSRKRTGRRPYGGAGMDLSSAAREKRAVCRRVWRRCARSSMRRGRANIWLIWHDAGR